MSEKEVEKVGPKKQKINWFAVYQYLLDYCQDIISTIVYTKNYPSAPEGGVRQVKLAK